MPKAIKNYIKFDPKSMEMMTGSALGGLWGASRLQARLHDRPVNDFFNVIPEFWRFWTPFGAVWVIVGGPKVDILTSKIDIWLQNVGPGGGSRKSMNILSKLGWKMRVLGVPNA